MPAPPDPPSVRRGAVCRTCDVESVTKTFCWREGKFFRSGNRDGLACGRVAPLPRGSVAHFEPAEAGHRHLIPGAGRSDDGREHAVEDLLGVFLGVTMLGSDALDQLGGVHVRSLSEEAGPHGDAQQKVSAPLHPWPDWSRQSSSRQANVPEIACDGDVRCLPRPRSDGSFRYHARTCAETTEAQLAPDASCCRRRTRRQHVIPTKCWRR